MLNRRTDLQLECDALGRFLPWLITFMVYLAVLALAGVMALNATSSRWNKGINNTLTVQIAPMNMGVEKETIRIQAALGVLNSTSGVIQANIISEGDIMALLEPWLGSLASAKDLPLPYLIDVALDENVELDMATLSKRLETAVSGASIDDHRVWLNRLINIIQTAEILAATVLVLICIATVGTVIFTTRTGLNIHQEVIEVLHHIGAQDTYIARQFANRALMLGLRGGFIGLGMGVLSIFGMGYLTAQMDVGFLPDFSLNTLHWAALASMPVTVAVIAMFTARITVIRTLAKMM